MSLMEARRLVWENIIIEVRQHGDLHTLIDDKKIAIHQFKAQLQDGRTDGEAKATIAKKYIWYLN